MPFIISEDSRLLTEQKVSSSLKKATLSAKYEFANNFMW